LQSAKFDPEAKFIRKYIKELGNVWVKEIHNPIDNNLDYARIIVNHNDAQRETRIAYRETKND
jgi:deoxyribodipyrimidine photolyase